MGRKKKILDITPPQDGNAQPHGDLKNNKVHIFVDDQNLFYGVTNAKKDKRYRIDFGKLLTEAAKDGNGKDRFISSALIAGVIPDDDTFWQKAKKEGFEVKRGYISNGQSKLDDAYLIADMVETIFTADEKPATIILIAGDADYIPALEKAVTSGWRVEVYFINRGRSPTLNNFVHQFRSLNPSRIEYIPNK